MGLNKAKQLGLEHWKKNLRGCDQHPPPSAGMIMITDSMVIFIEAFPKDCLFDELTGQEKYQMSRLLHLQTVPTVSN